MPLAQTETANATKLVIRTWKLTKAPIVMNRMLVVIPVRLAMSMALIMVPTLSPNGATVVDVGIQPIQMRQHRIDARRQVRNSPVGLELFNQLDHLAIFGESSLKKGKYLIGEQEELCRFLVLTVIPREIEPVAGELIRGGHQSVDLIVKVQCSGLISLVAN